MLCFWKFILTKEGLGPVVLEEEGQGHLKHSSSITGTLYLSLWLFLQLTTVNLHSSL